MPGLFVSHTRTHARAHTAVYSTTFPHKPDTESTDTCIQWSQVIFMAEMVLSICRYLSPSVNFMYVWEYITWTTDVTPEIT